VEEKHERMMDFAERLCFKGYPTLTDARKRKLWAEAKGFLETCIENGATGYEENPTDPHGLPCDTYHEYFERYDMSDAEYKLFDEGKGKKERNRFDSILSAICRSALDTLDGASGVFGFTVGDLRRMFDGEIPEWVAGLYEKPEEVLKAPDKAGVML